MHRKFFGDSGKHEEIRMLSRARNRHRRDSSMKSERKKARSKTAPCEVVYLFDGIQT